MKITHNDLIILGSKLLKNKFHCRIILKEPRAYTVYYETPDIIGWVFNKSILIECKTTKADFKAEQTKCFRRNNLLSLGHWRFYLTPIGLLSLEQIPKDWGLYETDGKRVFFKGGAKYSNSIAGPFKSNRDSEVALLLSTLVKRRAGML